MAISIDATVGGASANSYITLSDANEIIEGLVADDDVAAWDGSNTDNKNRALYTAAVRVDRERFLGSRVTNTQALQWPRQGVRKPDTYINTYSIGFPFPSKSSSSTRNMACFPILIPSPYLSPIKPYGFHHLGRF